MENKEILENELFECEVVDIAFTYGEPRHIGRGIAKEEE